MKNIYSSVENLETLGARVAQVKSHFQVNISEFAKQLGISHSFLSQIISGKRKPSYEFLCALSLKFNVNLHWLFSGNGEMISEPPRDNDIYNMVQELIEDPEVEALFVDLRIPAMKHFLLAHHQMLAESPDFKLRKKRFQLAEEQKEVEEAK